MPHATAIGLMSGTSYDGVDVALIDTDGEGIGRLGLSVRSRTFGDYVLGTQAGRLEGGVGERLAEGARARRGPGRRIRSQIREIRNRSRIPRSGRRN